MHQTLFNTMFCMLMKVKIISFEAFELLSEPQKWKMLVVDNGS